MRQKALAQPGNVIKAASVNMEWPLSDGILFPHDIKNNGDF